MFGFLKRRRHEAIRSRPFPPEWAAFVARAVHLYARLEEEDRRELEGDVQVFLEEKVFEGGDGLEITDEIRVTIAAQACLLLLHRDTEVYPDLETIVVYPGAYAAKVSRRDGPVVIEGREERLGESWSRGLVVLGWDQVSRDVRSTGTGHNVVLHEFAHQLDAEDGDVDGAPPLPSGERYRHWAAVLGAEYAELEAKLDAGRSTDIDPYAATNPGEFFAVVTEAFFERPTSLRARHPALYEELAAFYRLDPAAL